MPDDELLRCAETNTLRTPRVLDAQVRRMLKDPKAEALEVGLSAGSRPRPSA